MTTPTKDDIIAAAQATLDTAQDFAGVPRSSALLAALQQQVSTLTADRDAQKTRADKAEARLANLNAAIDAAQAAA